MSKKDEPEKLHAHVPTGLELPIMLLVFVRSYPLSLLVIVPVIGAFIFLSPSEKTAPRQAPQPPVEQQARAAPAQPAEVPPPPPAVPAASSEATAQYRIQVGAFESQARAVTLSRELAIMFSDVSIEPASGSGSLYRVYVGRFVDQPSAQPVMSRLQHEGLSPLIVPLEAPR